MIHVFLQDDTWICHNCVHYFCWELSALSRDWAGCPSHLLSESRRCRGYVAVFFTARLYLLFYATMQICRTLHNVLQHLSLFSTRCNKLLSTRHSLCCQICFHVMKIGQNQIGCNSPCTMHHLYHAPGAWCIVLPMLSRVLAAVSISTRKLASSNIICWALCILYIS